MTKRNSKPAVKKNNEKAANENQHNKKYYAFLLSMGGWEYIDSRNEAKSFQRDNAEIITERLTFATLEEMEMHKRTNKQDEACMTTPVSKNQGHKTSAGA